MVDVAKVIMFGMPIGTIRWDQRYEVARFEYDASFIGRGLEPSPLTMPVREGRVYSFAGLNRDTFMGLPGMLADALPDTYGRALFNKWLSLTGRTSGNPVETLCFLGKRCMGALEFQPAVDVPFDPNTQFEIDTLVSVAREALLEKSNFEANLSDDRRRARRRLCADRQLRWPYRPRQADFRRGVLARDAQHAHRRGAGAGRQLRAPDEIPRR